VILCPSDHTFLQSSSVTMPFSPTYLCDQYYSLSVLLHVKLEGWWECQGSEEFFYLQFSHQCRILSSVQKTKGRTTLQLHEPPFNWNFINLGPQSPRLHASYSGNWAVWGKDEYSSHTVLWRWHSGPLAIAARPVKQVCVPNACHKIRTEVVQKMEGNL
jgi:hypothetical protein